MESIAAAQHQPNQFIDWLVSLLPYCLPSSFRKEKIFHLRNGFRAGKPIQQLFSSFHHSLNWMMEERVWLASLNWTVWAGLVSFFIKDKRRQESWSGILFERKEWSGMRSRQRAGPPAITSSLSLFDSGPFIKPSFLGRKRKQAIAQQLWAAAAPSNKKVCLLCCLR